MTITLDTGAETSMIKATVARSLDITIDKSSQQALQADGVTPLTVVGETHINLSRANKSLTLDALVVEDLDVHILAGTPFLIANDVSVRPAKCQVRIQDSETIHYRPSDNLSSQPHVVRRTQSYVLRSSSPATVLWPGEYLEVDMPSDLTQDDTIAIELRTDKPSYKHTKASLL